jgi:Tfp pilus assembly protein PilN
MKQLLKNRWNPKQIVVVFYQNAGTDFELTAALVSSKKGIVSIDSFHSFDEIVSRFGKYVTYWIHADGTGVLTRIVDMHSDYKKDLLLNVDPDDFIFTSVKTETNRLVSFIRKSVVESFTQQFKENKLFLIGISCGFAPVGLLLQEDETISFDYKITKEKSQFHSLERLETLSLNQYYEGSYLSKKEFITIALGNAVFEVDATFESNRQDEIYAEFKEYSKFKLIGLTSILTLFLVVIVNYFYLNHLNDTVAEKEAEIALNNSNLSLLDKLTQEEIRKRQLAVNSNTSTPFFVSYFLDEIGKSVPEKIRLSEMYVFPLVQKLKEKRKVEVDKSRIEISGWTKDNTVLDDWIETLDRREWVKSVELVNYHQNDDEAEFKIIIFLAE